MEMKGKDKYQKPAMATVEALANLPMAWSPVGYNPGKDADPNSSVLSPGRRGSWGDLWEKKVENEDVSEK